MGRRARQVGSDAIYHVMARGNNRRPIFIDDHGRQRFMEMLVAVSHQRGWRGFAYCLMGNHFHLAFQTQQPDLPAGMRDLLVGYAKWFNHRHRRSGHLFGGRYRAVLIESDAQLLAVIRYIARNPVAAGLVTDPGDWRWSSYPQLVAGQQDDPFVHRHDILALFHPHRLRATRALMQFVADTANANDRQASPGTDTHPPTLHQLFTALPAHQATRAAADIGYTHAQIATAAGVTRSAITHRLRGPNPADHKHERPNRRTSDTVITKAPRTAKEHNQR